MILQNRQPNSGTKPTCPTWVAQKKTKKFVASISDQREYKVDENETDHRFPSQSNEKQGHWVGFADERVIILHGRYLLMKQTKS